VDWSDPDLAVHTAAAGARMVPRRQLVALLAEPTVEFDGATGDRSAPVTLEELQASLRRVLGHRRHADRTQVRVDLSRCTPRMTSIIQVTPKRSVSCTGKHAPLKGRGGGAPPARARTERAVAPVLQSNPSSPNPA
jgi:hypothetical protein